MEWEPTDPRFISEDHWVTQDGRVLIIREMEDRHLANTIRFLERRGYAAAEALERGPRIPSTLLKQRCASRIR